MISVIVHFLCSQEGATQGSNDAKQVCENLLMCVSCFAYLSLIRKPRFISCGQVDCADLVVVQYVCVGVSVYNILGPGMYIYIQSFQGF